MWNIKSLLIIFLFLNSPSALAVKRIVVLDYNGIENSQVLEQLSDETRGGALDAIGKNDFQIITKENMLDLLLSQGKDLSCISGSCEVEIARNIGADLVFSGNLIKVEGSYILSLKLHETKSGSLLASKKIVSESQLEIIQKTRNVSFNMMNSYTTDSTITKTIDHKTEIKLQKRALINFQSQPSGQMTVLVDGLPICHKTPCTESVLVGEREIQFFRKNYIPWKENINIKGATTISGKLNPNFGWITVISQTTDINISIDGKQMGTGSIRKAPLAEGIHNLTVDGECHKSVGKQFQIKNGDVKKIELDLVKKNVETSIIALDEEGNNVFADLLLDGKLLGRSPFSGIIPLCSNQLKLKYKDEEQNKQLQLEEGVENRTTFKIKNQKNRRNFNPPHFYGSLYTFGVNDYGIDLNLIEFQYKSRKSPIKNAGFRMSFINFDSIADEVYFFPMGLGYLFDLNGLVILPYYQVYWLGTEGFGATKHSVGADYYLDLLGNKRKDKKISFGLQFKTSCSMSTNEYPMLYCHTGGSILYTFVHWR